MVQVELNHFFRRVYPHADQRVSIRVSIMSRLNPCQLVSFVKALGRRVLPLKKNSKHSLNNMYPEYSSINYPTWKKYIVLSRTIESLRVKDKRNIFQMMRVKEDVNEDTFFPMYGFTAGEFATWQVLKDANSRKKI